MEKLSNNIKDYQFVNYYPNDNSITFNNYPFQNLSKYKFSKIDFYRNTIDINETVWCICFPDVIVFIPKWLLNMKKNIYELNKIIKKKISFIDIIY